MYTQGRKVKKKICMTFQYKSGVVRRRRDKDETVKRQRSRRKTKAERVSRSR